ncbi:MAG TPA: HNH endonuclease signature motif containing protein [Candidatus Sulfotelmatobacter sp.]|nr:HNH endonuclease signature motif containing protein [Candidatus Sulfotelmatobacter sp.]
MAERLDVRTRRLLAQRAGFRCEYCLTPAGLAPSPYSAEHILPRSKGGADTPENLALSCQGCNGHKAARITALDPATRKTVPLFHPRRQKWSEHFGWAADGTRVEGKSPTGRATVVALHLNRPGLLNLRRLMVLANLHPPAE